MGANHFSQSVFGAAPEAVRDLLVRWLQAKGFDLVDGEPLTPLDPQHERGLLLAWQRDRTVVLYSDLGELPRLQFELHKLDAAVLDYWMHDSDIWGYQMRVRGEVVDAFHSDPAYFGGWEDIEGPRDPDALCGAVGAPDLADEVRGLQTKKALFSEDVSTRFVTLLGVPAAASQYGHLDGGGWPPEGFAHEHLWFRRAGWDPMAGWTVERIRVEAIDPKAWQVDLSDEERVAMESAERQARWIGGALRILFWPLTLVFRAYMWWRMRTIRREAEHALEGLGTDRVPGVRLPGPPASVEEADGRLSNRRHRCSIPLPEGAVVEQRHRIAWLPNQVFAFAVEGVEVVCNAMLPSQVAAMTRFPIEHGIVDSSITEGHQTVRWIEATWDVPGPPGAPDAPQAMWRLFAFVAGPRAFYTFTLYAPAPASEDARAAVREAALGLRFDMRDPNHEAAPID